MDGDHDLRAARIAGLRHRAMWPVRPRLRERSPSQAIDECDTACSTQGVRAPDCLTEKEWAAIVGELNLSTREAQMVWHANYDESVAAIATCLGISENTVHTYRNRLYKKLGVSSFCQVLAIVFATHVGLHSRQGRISASHGD
jgi:DNA-binding CsgD family transcriptional regulator